MQTTSRAHLTAADVQSLLDIDRSTVYRMAADGRLPAVRVGRQWRFPVEELERLYDLDPRPGTRKIDAEAAHHILEAVAPSLRVMMVVTDLHGLPITPIVNPTAWMARHDQPETVLSGCLDEWRELAADLDLMPRFVESVFGFECARAFVRSGPELVGMVLAGGIAPLQASDSEFVTLAPPERAAVLDALPRISALISQFAINHKRGTQ
jgi:excisionase family DNA binding protein